MGGASREQSVPVETRQGCHRQHLPSSRQPAAQAQQSLSLWTLCWSLGFRKRAPAACSGHWQGRGLKCSAVMHAERTFGKLTSFCRLHSILLRGMQSKLPSKRHKVPSRELVLLQGFLVLFSKNVEITSIKVKIIFNCRQDFRSLQNFKILHNCRKRHVGSFPGPLRYFSHLLSHKLVKSLRW